MVKIEWGPFTLWGAMLALIALGMSIGLLIGRKKGRFVIRFKGGGKRLLEGEDLRAWSNIAFICMGILFTGGILLFLGILPPEVIIPLFLVCVFTMVLTAKGKGRSI